MAILRADHDPAARLGRRHAWLELRSNETFADDRGAERDGDRAAEGGPAAVATAGNSSR
ncbi:MAG: hypothetical protein M3292_03100 [Actinomycetota bacterium]|nr:hypothetical protein [Actinomycetota bacterium]